MELGVLAPVGSTAEPPSSLRIQGASPSSESWSGGQDAASPRVLMEIRISTLESTAAQA